VSPSWTQTPCTAKTTWALAEVFDIDESKTRWGCPLTGVELVMTAPEP